MMISSTHCHTGWTIDMVVSTNYLVVLLLERLYAQFGACEILTRHVIVVKCGARRWTK